MNRLIANMMVVLFVVGMLVLKGRRMLLLWCRDGRNDWRSEFE